MACQSANDANTSRVAVAAREVGRKAERPGDFHVEYLFCPFRATIPPCCVVFTGLSISVLCLASFAGAASANVVVVLNSRDATIQLIDQQTYAPVATFPVGKEPHHLMATPDNKSVIVASSVGNELIFLDPNTGQIQRRVKDVLDPYQIGFSPDQKWFVSASLRLDRVDIYKYDGANLTLTSRVPLGKLPSHMAFNKASDTVFITRQGSDQVSAIDLATQHRQVDGPGRQAAGGHRDDAGRQVPAGRHHGQRLCRGDRLAHAENGQAHQGRRRHPQLPFARRRPPHLRVEPRLEHASTSSTRRPWKTSA